MAPLLLAPAAPAQTVHVVDGNAGPGSTHTTIQAAVDAAADGDVVLVRLGAYGEDLHIDGKSLVVQAEVATNGLTACYGALGTPCLDTLVVENIAVDQSVAVRGFEIYGAGSVTLPVDYAIELRDSAGTIWLEDVASTIVLWPLGVFSGLRVVDCDSVVLSGCFLDADAEFAFSPAFEFRDSSVELYDSKVSGAWDNADPEDAALLVTRRSVGISESEVRGGAGYEQCYGHGACNPRLVGELGLKTVDAFVEIRDSVITGGQGNPPGPATSITGGTLVELTSNARSFDVAVPARVGSNVSFTVTGEPQDRVWAYYASAPARALRHRLFDGGFVLASPFFSLPVGTLPSGGTLSLGFPVPSPPPGADGYVLFVQGLFLDDAGQGFVVSEPTVVAHLGPGL